MHIYRVAHVALFVVPLFLAEAFFPQPSAAQADSLACTPGTLLFVVDRSSSMRERLPSGETKWDVAARALLQVAEGSPTLHLGTMVFPFPDACSPGEILLAPGPHAPEEVAWVLEESPSVVGDFTPIAQTLGVLEGSLPRPTHVVLVTDGWQWCAPYDPSMRGAPTEVVRRLRAEGHTIHIVGFGAAVDARTLNASARAGGAPLAGCDASLEDPRAEGHCYHAAHASVALLDALAEVAFAASSEVCDGFDNDCDGAVDEGPDADGDGVSVCAGDCDDTDPATFPGATELCDGVDRDCDGVLSRCACEGEATRSCTQTTGRCTGGTQTCRGGTWSACEGVPAPMPEACNARDDDCDGILDEDAACPASERCVAGACGVDLPESAPLPTLKWDGGVDSAVQPWAPSIAPSCACRIDHRVAQRPSAWFVAALPLFGVWRKTRRRAF